MGTGGGAVSTKPNVEWSHCNECGQETKHDIIHRAERRRTYDDDRYSVDVGSSWKLLQCCGCEDLALRRVDWCSEDDPHGGPNPSTYFPPRVSRRKPAWVERLEMPDEYGGLLDEVYAALHADSRRLAIMGARALIDMAIQRNVGDQHTFEGGLKELEAKQLVSARDREIIEAAVEVGHASAHRGHQASSDSVNVVIDIVERLIHSEILAEQARELRKNIPPRPPRPPRTKKKP